MPRPACLRLLLTHRSADRISNLADCFLVVDAFAALLCTLGFSCSFHTAGVGEDPLLPEKMGNHVVLLVHLADGRRFVADVGLGDGPAQPFELVPHSWIDKAGYRFSLEERSGGTWHFTHDPLGSFQGFDFDLSTSVASSLEFARYHAAYWTDASSPYHTSGPVLQRVSPTEGILSLRCRTLKRIHPSLSGGSQVLSTAADQAHWRQLVAEHFHLPLAGLCAAQLDAVWEAACTKHEAWQQSQTSEPAAGRPT